MLKQRWERGKIRIKSFQETSLCFIFLPFLLFVINLTLFRPLPTLPHASPRDIFFSCFFFVLFYHTPYLWLDLPFTFMMDKLCHLCVISCNQNGSNRTKPNQYIWEADKVKSLPFPTHWKWVRTTDN